MRSAAAPKIKRGGGAEKARPLSDRRIFSTSGLGSARGTRGKRLGESSCTFGSNIHNAGSAIRHTDGNACLRGPPADREDCQRRCSAIQPHDRWRRRAADRRDAYRRGGGIFYSRGKGVRGRGGWGE